MKFSWVDIDNVSTFKKILECKYISHKMINETLKNNLHYIHNIFIYLYNLQTR